MLEVKTKDSDVGKDYKTVTIKNTDDDSGISVTMRAGLARTIKTHLEAMREFKHGVLCDDKLVAMFRHEHDRDHCQDMLETMYDDGNWEVLDV